MFHINCFLRVAKAAAGGLRAAQRREKTHCAQCAGVSLVSTVVVARLRVELCNSLCFLGGTVRFAFRFLSDGIHCVGRLACV